MFSRIGSREALQRAVLEEYDRRFMQDVFVPAMREPRGLPRLNTIMRLWLQRARDVEIRQGCIYCAGAFEFDDREGPLRDALLDGVMRWRSALKRTVIQAIDQGHLRPDTDAEQLVFEMDALFTGLMRDARFLRDPRAPDRAWSHLGAPGALAHARPRRAARRAAGRSSLQPTTRHPLTADERLQRLPAVHDFARPCEERNRHVDRDQSLRRRGRRARRLGLLRLMRAVPRSNADFGLPGAA